MNQDWSDISSADWGVQSESVSDKQKQEKSPAKSSSHRRSTELIELSDKFLMRRAFGEDQLLQRMGIEELLPNHSYHCITGGNVDSLSYLKVVLLHAKHLNYLLCSTWCMAAEDIYQLQEWVETGVIDHLDIYVGGFFRPPTWWNGECSTNYTASTRTSDGSNALETTARYLQASAISSTSLSKRVSISTQIHEPSKE